MATERVLIGLTGADLENAVLKALNNTAGEVKSVSSKTGTVTLDKDDVGLSNIDNTSDLSKPISTTAQSAIDGKADIDKNLRGILVGDILYLTTDGTDPTP